MSIDITNNPETQILREKYLNMGVPESLFDAFVNEANNEYNSTIGYEDFTRFSILTVNLSDDDETENCFYLYNLANNGFTLFGYFDTSKTHIFGQIPNVNISIQIFKIKSNFSNIISYGNSASLISKDSTITITLTKIGSETNLANSKFSVGINETLNLTEDIYTLIPFNIKNYDNLTEFNTTSNTFKAKQAGYYIFQIFIWLSHIDADKEIRIKINKNVVGIIGEDFFTIQTGEDYKSITKQFIGYVEKDAEINAYITCLTSSLSITIATFTGWLIG